MTQLVMQEILQTQSVVYTPKKRSTSGRHMSFQPEDPQKLEYQLALIAHLNKRKFRSEVDHKVMSKAQKLPQTEALRGFGAEDFKKQAGSKKMDLVIVKHVSDLTSSSLNPQDCSQQGS
jgi:hypothetical protein